MPPDTAHPAAPFGTRARKGAPVRSLWLLRTRQHSAARTDGMTSDNVVLIRHPCGPLRWLIREHYRKSFDANLTPLEVTKQRQDIRRHARLQHRQAHLPPVILSDGRTHLHPACQTLQSRIWDKPGRQRPPGSARKTVPTKERGTPVRAPARMPAHRPEAASGARAVMCCAFSGGRQSARLRHIPRQRELLHAGHRLHAASPVRPSLRDRRLYDTLTPPCSFSVT